MKSSFRIGWEERQAALLERGRVQAQKFEAQFKAMSLAEQAALRERVIKQFLTGKTSKSDQCESQRERESNEFDRQTESQLCQTDKQTVRSREPASEKDNENRQTNEHTEKCERERDRHTGNISVYK